MSLQSAARHHALKLRRVTRLRDLAIRAGINGDVFEDQLYPGLMTCFSSHITTKTLDDVFQRLRSLLNVNKNNMYEDTYRDDTSNEADSSGTDDLFTNSNDVSNDDSNSDNDPEDNGSNNSDDRMPTVSDDNSNSDDSVIIIDDDDSSLTIVTSMDLENGFAHDEVVQECVQETLLSILNDLHEEFDVTTGLSLLHDL